jgi:hypothetical protein
MKEEGVPVDLVGEVKAQNWFMVFPIFSDGLISYKNYDSNLN